MPRRLRNSKIDSRTARLDLPQRREPYWMKISPGCYLGYRTGASGRTDRAGTWIARMRDDEGRQHYEAVGAAADARDADGLSIFDCAQAQARARTFFDAKARQLAGGEAPTQGPYTVADALNDYFSERDRRGSKGVAADRYAAGSRIEPSLGQLEVAKLTTKRLRQWLSEVEAAPKLRRTAKGAESRAVAEIDRDDPDAVRARKATANRIMTVLKAALNLAYQEGRATSDEAWRKLKPFREVDEPVVRYLSAAECVRLVNACAEDFRALVRGALVTGCRYGELTRMKVVDFNADAGVVSVRRAKSGKGRHVVLNDEGARLFASLTAGRRRTDLIFERADGGQWGASHQQRPLAAASRNARIEPATTFHGLRHTYATALAMKGVPMRVIADQLGHSDTRLTERHYAHLAPSHVAEVVRAALPGFGIVPETSKIVPIAS